MKDPRPLIEEAYRQVSGSQQVPWETPFADLPGWDSLRFAEFIIHLQRRLGVRFAPRDIVAIDSLQTTASILSGY